MHMIEIRKISDNEIVFYLNLTVCALKEESDAFGASLDYELSQPESHYEIELKKWG